MLCEVGLLHLPDYNVNPAKAESNPAPLCEVGLLHLPDYNVNPAKAESILTFCGSSEIIVQHALRTVETTIHCIATET